MKRSMDYHREQFVTKMVEIPEVTKRLELYVRKLGEIDMGKKIRKKYHSEAAVKKALKIDSFRNLSKDKVMEFTSMIPYMEKEVAIEIIKQFPEYIDFAKALINNYADICKEILEINKESYKQAVSAHQIALETFAKQIENTELTPKERVNFSNKMVEEAEKIPELYLQQQKFHERILKNVGGTIAIVVLAGATILGLKAIGNDDLPQIDEEDDDAA